MKRIISVFLAVSMLISILPAVSIASAGDAQAITYNFQILPSTIADADGACSYYTYTTTDNTFQYAKQNAKHRKYNGTFRFQRKDVSTVGEWIAFYIQVPGSGYYDIALDWAMVSGSTKTEVHIFKLTEGTDVATACNALTSVRAIGYVTASGAKTRASEQVNKNGSVYLEKGQNVLAFRLAEANCGWQAIYSLTLAPQKLLPVIANYTAPATELESGNTTDMVIEVSDKLSDGETEAGDITIEYKTNDKNIADVDASGKITAIGAGEAEITATISAANCDNTISKTAKVKVVKSEYPATDNVTLKYNFNILPLEVADKENNVLGNYTKELSHDMFYYVNQTAKHRKYANAFRMTRRNTGVVGEWVAFKINVPISGDYNVELDWQAVTAPTNTEVHIFKAPDGMSLTDACNARASEDAIGSVIETAPTGRKVDRISSEPISLTTGEYILLLRFAEENCQWTAIYALNLIEGTGENKLLIDTEIKDFENGKVNLDILMSDWSLLDAADATVTYESGNENVVRVDAEGNIEEVAPGTTDITVTVEYGGATRIAKKEYYISDGGINVQYNLAKALSTLSATSPLANINYDITNCFFKVRESSVASPDGTALSYSNGYIKLGAGNYVSFEVEVPKDATYRLNANYPKMNDGGSVDVYINDADTYNSSSLGEKAGSFDCKNTSGSNTTVTGNVELLECKKYVITFVPNGGFGYIGSFTLVSGDTKGTVLMSVGMEDIVGSQPKIYGIMSDGSRTDDISRLSVTYSISDEDVAKIDTSTGAITDVSSGELEVTATATIGTRTVYAKKPYLALKSARGTSYYVDFGAKLSDCGIGGGSGKSFTLVNFDKTDGIYRFFGGSGDTENDSFRRARPGNVAIRHGQYISFEVLFPEAGVYDMEMWNAATDFAGDINVYLSKNGSSLKAEDKVGEYNCYDAAIAYNPSYFKDIVTEPNIVKNFRIKEPGYYIITFESDCSSLKEHSSDWEYAYGSVGSFRLISGEDSVLIGAFPADNREESEYILLYPDEKVIEYTDPNVPGQTKLNVAIKKLNGEASDKVFDSISYSSADPAIAEIAADGTITAITDGDVDVSASATYGGKVYSGTISVNAYDDTGIESATIEVPSEIYVRETKKAQLIAFMKSGNKVKVPWNNPVVFSELGGLLKVAEDGTITGAAPGDAVLRAEAFFRGDEIDVTADIKVTLDQSKSEPSYYTYEKRKIAKENIQKYSWAKSARNTAVEAADAYVTNYAVLYDRIPREGIPRARQVTHSDDSEYYKYCRYCGGDVEGSTSGGYGGWAYNPINRPWKIQCTICKRLFPSNDFATLYQYGLDENGIYDADRAKAVNAEKVASGEGKNAYINELYPEIGEQVLPEYGGEPGVNVTLNNGRGLRPGETVEGWGVDDGWGYRPVDENGNNYRIATGDIEITCYIANYMMKLTNNLSGIVYNLAMAYVYTDDERYGRAGAILLDRIADLLPEYDLQYQYKKDGTRINNNASGYFTNQITDVESFSSFVLATDALFPMKDDTQVISFLSSKAAELGLENKKETGDDIWRNWKHGVILECFEGIKTHRLFGNFGMPQRLAASCAVALNEEPESSEMVKWIYAAGDLDSARPQGGNVLPQLIDEVSRDGLGTESGDNYNAYWYTRLFEISEYLEAYKGDEKYNLWEHPKFAKMFTGFKKKILVNNQLAQIGDSSSPAMTGMSGDLNAFLYAFQNYKDTDFGAEIAQYIYQKNRYNLSDLHYSILTKNPESLQSEIKKIVTDNPEQKNEMLAGYGFAILRDGGNYLSASAADQKNTLRDAWLYFGAAKSHSHQDNLNLGLEAFGLNIAPDNGYPERTGKDANRYQWHNATISHNTVTINEKNSIKGTINNGVPLHFDDTKQVKLIDVDASCSYNEAENYRRTLVMVKVDDENSYTLDFFRITGGDVHTYSFHSQAENAVAVSGLDNMIEQKDENGNWVGTFASGVGQDGQEYVGVDVPYQDLKGNWKDANGNPYLLKMPGQDPHTQDLWDYETYFPRGYSWMSKVRRDRAPSSEFAVEFDVVDYRDAVLNGDGIRLRLTQLNSFTPSEVAIVGGPTPRKDSSDVLPETFDYLLVQNKGNNIDSLYATVFEPYRNNRYIESIEKCAVEGISDNDPSVRAIKVTHVGGKRIDYIVYSEDNERTLRIDNLFDFRGFIGYYSINDKGEILSRYVNDGDLIGEKTDEVSAYTGMVAGFDGETEFGDFENFIDIKVTNTAVDEKALSNIVGRWIFIENDGVENAAYEILGAEKLSEDTVRLDTGNVTNIRSYVDAYKPEEGYIYNMSIGDNFRIPVSESDDSSPIFDVVNNAATSAGSTVTVEVNAESPLDGKTITYIGETLPRGASFNSETGVVTWKPDDSQVGENHVAITARDSDGREATTHFNITVYGRTTGSKNESTEAPSTGSTGTSAGGGGGGGGTAPTDKPATNADETDDAGVADNTETEVENAPDASGETDSIRFTDLGSYAWAENAINALAVDGVIKGTTASTFSPAANITRADFALLLVRAFNLTSNNTENFADVNASDYFATELAIARNTGIVGGIGDNKYAPRNSITRQDMMVIVCRALKAIGIELEAREVEYPDIADVSDYAKDAVKALITAGLVNGKNGFIAPADHTTRAEVAVLVKRILDYVK